MSEERLQKLLARAGVASRRGAEELIRAGRVTVNGAVAELGQKVAPADAVKVDGKAVSAPTPGRTLLLNKPDGYLCTRDDPRGRPTIYDLLPRRWHRLLFPVGRLDFHSEGLILLTDDGELAQRVAHPRYGCTKTYEVKVKGRPDAAALEKLRRPIVLDGRATTPARVEPMAPRGRRPARNSWWRVELSEGRTRQIRELFFRAGHPVQKLRRVAIGGLRDAALQPGDFRDLEPAEVALLTAGGDGAKKRPRRRRGAKPRAGGG